MAEECGYYFYDNGYSCELKREKEGNSTIDSETVHKYCWGYHYENCPRYKKRISSSGPCYLTSACVEARGLPDNCRELTILRTFRDGYMKSLPNGSVDIEEYYRCAPMIITRIRERTDAKEIFNRIYEELVLPCVELIEAGNNHDAYNKYKDYTKRLQNMFIH